MKPRFRNIFTNEMVTQLGTFPNGDVYYQKDHPVVIEHKGTDGRVKKTIIKKSFVKPKSTFYFCHCKVD